MNLKELPAVKIGEGRGMLYILCVVIDDGDTTKRNKLVLRGDRNSGMHEKIFLKLKLEELANTNLRPVCIGGGKLLIDSEEKKIFIWGKSDDYRREPREDSFTLLREAYPDYEIIIDQSPFEKKT